MATNFESRGGQTTTIGGLDTYTTTITSTQMHTASIKVSNLPASGISVVIKQGASTLATSTAPAAAQNHIELQVTFNGVASDVISFVITSSVASDQTPQSFKALLSVRAGTV